MCQSAAVTIVIVAAFVSAIIGQPQNEVSSDSVKSAQDSHEDAGLKFNRIELSVPSHRVFRFAFNPRLFLWEAGNLGDGERRPTYAYMPMTEGSSGLPEWIKYKYSQRHKAG